ncbi:MAG: hypothetical protein V2A71_06710, partial [Candidatus Eisenbacteria bacterium]
MPTGKSDRKPKPPPPDSQLTRADAEEIARALVSLTIEGKVQEGGLPAGNRRQLEKVGVEAIAHYMMGVTALQGPA